MRMSMLLPYPEDRVTALQQHLIWHIVPMQVDIKPQENTSLEGLYKSSGNFCTQCEAEGFRGITYFLDRWVMVITKTPFDP